MLKRTVFFLAMAAVCGASTLVMQLGNDGTVRTWPAATGHDPLGGRTVVDSAEFRLTAASVYLDTSKYYIDNALYSAVWTPATNFVAQWLDGVDGTAATAVAGDPGTYAGNNCRVFNGVDEKCEFGQIGNLVDSTATDFSLELIANLDDLVVFDPVIGKYLTSVLGWRMDSSSAGTLNFLVYTGSSYGISIPKPTGWHTNRIERVSDQYKWYVDGSLQTLLSDSLSGANITQATTGGTPLRMASRNSSPYGAFSISYLKLVEDGVTTLECTFSSGPSTIEYDVSGNGNHGTYTSGDIAATATTADAIPPHNIVNGFSYFKENTTNGANGTVYGVDAFTNLGDGAYSMVETTDGGGGMAIPGTFTHGVGATYLVEYRLTGSADAAFRIRNSSGPNGNGAYGALNLSNAILDGEWHSAGFTATENYTYLQAGLSTAGNMNLTAEFIVTCLDIQVPGLASGSGLDAQGNPVAYPGGAVHNGAESLLVSLAGTNTYADLLAWGPASNGPIQHVLVYTNTPPDIAELDAWCLENGGVWTNLNPEPPVAESGTDGDLFPAIAYYEPTNAYPFETASYAPPVSNYTADASAPLVYEYSRTADPGGPLQMSGTVDADFAMYATGYTNAFTTTNTLALGSAPILPAGAPEDVYLVWPTNANGYGEGIVVNAADLWWVGFDKVAPGETFNLYGRNLMLGSADCYAYIDGHGWITNTGGNRYKAEFTCPDLAQGTYTVRAHNGRGGKYGWSGPAEFEVVDGFPDWDAGTTYNITTNDSLASIQATIDGASYGDTLHFADGQYNWGTSLKIRSGRRILGNGTNTYFFASADDPASDACLFYFYGKGHSNSVIDSVRMRMQDYDNMTILADDFTRAQVLNCKIEKQRGTTDRDWSNALGVFWGSDNILFSNCVFEVSGNMFINDALSDGTKQVRFEDCEFYGSQDANSIISISKGFEGFDLNNSYFSNLDPSDNNVRYGWAESRWVVGNGPGYNHYFGNNVSSNVIPRLSGSGTDYAARRSDGIDDANQGSGEQILYEGLASRYHGAVVSATSNSVTVASLSYDTVPTTVSIMEGTGAGQSRRISGIAGNTIDIEGTWRVAPDATSRISAGNQAARIVCHANVFDGRERAAEEDVTTAENTSTTAFQLYGGGFDCVVDGNTAQQLYVGFNNWGFGDITAGSETETSAILNGFNRFVDNTAFYCYHGFAERYQRVNQPYTGNANGIGFNTYEGNTATNCLGNGFLVYDQYGDMMMANDMFHANTAVDCANDLLITSGLVSSNWFVANSWQ